MIETPTIDDLGLPEVLYDHDSDTKWHLNDPNVSVEVKIEERFDERNLDQIEPSSYPLATLASKVEHGDLQTEPPAPEPAFECDECGDTFETEHGLLTHQGSAHGEDEPEPEIEEEPDDEDE